MKILNSASKIVFIMMAYGTLVFTAMSFLSGEQFMILAGMAFGYYFSRNGQNGGSND